MDAISEAHKVREANAPHAQRVKVGIAHRCALRIVCVAHEVSAAHKVHAVHKVAESHK